jgi:hypothetical protein
VPTRWTTTASRAGVRGGQAIHRFKALGRARRSFGSGALCSRFRRLVRSGEQDGAGDHGDEREHPHTAESPGGSRRTRSRLIPALR